MVREKSGNFILGQKSGKSQGIFVFLYFSLFSSATSAALNTIQISYGISYFRHRDSSDIFTCDIAQQSVVDKMVREISLEVREKSGKSQGILFSHFCGNPVYITSVNISYRYCLITLFYLGGTIQPRTIISYESHLITIQFRSGFYIYILERSFCNELGCERVRG